MRATDPHQTQALWKRVHAAKPDMMQSGRGKTGAEKRGRGGTGRGNRGSSAIGRVLREPDADELGSTLSAPSSAMDAPDLRSIAESTTTIASKAITPRNPKFKDTVLGPRGITIIQTNAITASPFAHFRTAGPPSEGAIDYSRLEGLGGANIWLGASTEFTQSITEEYMAMQLHGLCEEEHASFAKENIFKRERRSVNVPEDRQWRAERMLQLVAAPNNDMHWQIPPVLEGRQGVDWSFDLRPDCSYWLSLRGFNPSYRVQVRNATYVIKRWITCPYFTVEFKRDGESQSVAIAQVAAAGSLALYNRYQLRKDALTACKRDWNSDDIAPLRHYAITFVGPEFDIWILQVAPVGADGCWTGCTMKKLYGSECTDTHGANDLLSWTNEIHRWGLSKHGPSCEQDIKTVLRGEGVRTSAVQGLEERQ